MAAWFYVIWYIIKGEASQVNASLANVNVQKASQNDDSIGYVLVGLSILASYFFGYLIGGAVDAGTMNIIYNLADFWKQDRLRCCYLVSSSSRLRII